VSPLARIYQALVSGIAGVALLTAAGCGNAGESGKTKCSLCGEMNDLRGSISTKSGSQAEMAAWEVVSFEYDTGIARLGDVDDAGLYSLNRVRTDHQQTLALLTPDYILAAVLSITVPNQPAKTIHQFVNFDAPIVPKLISNGPVITFENLNGLNITKKLAAASNNDGIPDGATKITAPTALVGNASAGFALADPIVDTNKDGIPNDLDPDINGDGIINWLDYDQDGNGILNDFDPDQNGDLIRDDSPLGHNTSQYFNEGVEYIAVEFELTPKDDGSGNVNTLKFLTKIRDDLSPVPLAVQIRGAPTLLKSATYTAKDTQGTTVTAAFNGSLADDGQNEDGAANDRLFGRKIILPDGISPQPNQVIFFELVFGTKANPWYIDYPWTFPPVIPAPITAAYDSNLKMVALIGNPFGDIQDFQWIINVFDDQGHNVWQSGAVDGTTRQYAISTNILEPGKSYKFSVDAQSRDKVPSVPSFVVHSPQYPIQ